MSILGQSKNFVLQGGSPTPGAFGTGVGAPEMFVEGTDQWNATPVASCLEQNLPPMHMKASTAREAESGNQGALSCSESQPPVPTVLRHKHPVPFSTPRLQWLPAEVSFQSSQ